MLESEKAYLFGDYRIATAQVGESLFRHTFGGPHDRSGGSVEACKGIRIHLLHRIDLSDPMIPIAIAGCRWLPLYFCFNLSVSRLGYRLISDEEMEIYFPDLEFEPTVDDWPTMPFPTEFEKHDFCVTHVPFDKNDPSQVHEWAGIFGIGHLSKKVQAALKDAIRRGFEDIYETDDDIESALIAPFFQGIAIQKCLNPRCPNRSKACRMPTIAVMRAEPIAGVQVFGPDAEDTQLIFEMCSVCSTIHASNEIAS